MKQQGFTLLEAIVALVLIATTGMALFSWINTNLLNLQRVQAFQQRHDATQSALAFMETVNPLENPTGKETIGSYVITWQAKTLKPPQYGISHMGNKSIFHVGLYATTITVKYDETLLAQFTLHQMGYKQMRRPHAWLFDEEEM